MKLHKAVKKMVKGHLIRRSDWPPEHYLECLDDDGRIWFNCDSGIAVSYEFGIYDFDYDWIEVE